ncbi:MAG: 3-methyl-2-oxobutanoate dehydrogenase (2-methylpropanoyl-transferring) subunit alpha [Aquisalinus sp.]|nr:3-methyl-2-oxobutanoate dehydrogenase (2-methylpropanoyl-transferring) subunit alpha [Aquisalinus sp.]
MSENNNDYAPLQIHVPEPPFRPGDAPDFSNFDVPVAGATPRPPIDASREDLEPYSEQVIRVLDDDGKAQGEWVPNLSDEEIDAGMRAMMRTRAFDERMMKAQRQGKTSFYMQCTGEEAIATAQQRALREGDMHFPTYRQQGLLFAQDWPVSKMMNQIFSNIEDELEGLQLPVLYSFRDAGFFTVSGNLATQYIQAVGWAMASAIAGDTKIASAWIGDGATAEGDFHAGLNFASVYKAPCILNVVDNRWAISTYHDIARSGMSTFAERAYGYGLAALRVDGNDWLAAYAASEWAAERARRGHGATLIEWVTYRAGAHSTSDDPTKYRPKEEATIWPLGDPIERLKQHLIVKGLWSEERHVQAEAQYADEMREEMEKAEANGTLHEYDRPRPSPKAMFEYVYADMPEHLRRQRQEMGV